MHIAPVFKLSNQRKRWLHHFTKVKSEVAELRSDGKWHVSTDFDEDFAVPSQFDVKYFFDVQELDKS